MKITEHDAITGETIEREATTEEIASITSEESFDFAAHLAAKEAARESRRQKLIALGLTEEELDA